MFNRVGNAPRFAFQISNLKSQISNIVLHTLFAKFYCFVNKLTTPLLCVRSCALII